MPPILFFIKILFFFENMFRIQNDLELYSIIIFRRDMV